MVYKLKVYRLPLGTPQARGKALVNLLPLDEGETITAFLPLPEDETTWDEMFVMLATSAGTIRRNRLSDFVEVKANGKIAMKLEDEAQLIGVQTCTEENDVMLATEMGKAIRFPVTDVRVFAGRNSVGVRGIKLAKGDSVISLSVLAHVEATPEERENYLSARSAERRLTSGEYADPERKARDEETVKLLCSFEHGEIVVDVNYTRETANGATAMISDKEIVWTPQGGDKGLAVINRYTGVMQISKGRNEFLGMCNRVTEE